MKHEPTPQWRKSSHSGHQGGECVELAELSGAIGIRDSKNPDGHVHTLSRSAFRAFAWKIRSDGLR